MPHVHASRMELVCPCAPHASFACLMPRAWKLAHVHRMPHLHAVCLAHGMFVHVQSMPLLHESLSMCTACLSCAGHCAGLAHHLDRQGGQKWRHGALHAGQEKLHRAAQCSRCVVLPMYHAAHLRRKRYCLVCTGGRWNPLCCTWLVLEDGGVLQRRTSTGSSSIQSSVECLRSLLVVDMPPTLFLRAAAMPPGPSTERLVPAPCNGSSSERVVPP